jgi:hypothetical protein
VSPADEHYVARKLGELIERVHVLERELAARSTLVVVPREPSPAMLEAGGVAVLNFKGENAGRTAQRVWHAMVKAAGQ